MSFILNPLLFNILLISMIFLLIRIIFILLRQSLGKSINLYQYKIHNLYVSWIIVLCYIIIGILTVYLIRLYLLPRNVDLLFQYNNAMYTMQYVFTFMKTYDIFIKLYMLIVLILIITIFIFFIVTLQKTLYKEIHKLFLYYNAKDRKIANKPFRLIKNKLFALFLRHDIFLWFLQTIAGLSFSLKKYNNNCTWDNVPRYHPYCILNSISAKGYYTKIIRVSPLIILLYDCVFNSFVVTHVFYYLLFYLPLMLLKRIVEVISTTAPYINEMLYDIYYREETCLYTVSPNLKIMLDSYLLSGIKINYDLGLNTELVIVALIRFELAFQHGPLNETYVNEEGEFIHTYDRIHYYHVISDDDNTPVHGAQWHIIANKTK